MAGAPMRSGEAGSRPYCEERRERPRRLTAVGTVRSTSTVLSALVEPGVVSRSTKVYVSGMAAAPGPRSGRGQPLAALVGDRGGAHLVGRLVRRWHPNPLPLT